MSGRYFLDTNILVYTFDGRVAAKRDRCMALVERALDRGEGVVSYQVVQEFLSLATRKFARKFSREGLRTYLERVLLPLCEVYPGPELYRQALMIHVETGFSIYDSLIVAAADSAGCAILYSEDLQDGRDVRRVRISNPFKQPEES